MKISRLIKAIAIGLVAMTAPAVAGNLNSPQGLAVDASGDLDVVNFFASTVVKFDKKFASPPKLIKDGLDHPYSIAIDTTGLIYVGNLAGNRITAYAPSGARVPPAEIASRVSPTLLATGPITCCMPVTA
jgi:DNA-binding beta-propeller fold protein YncE